MSNNRPFQLVLNSKFATKNSDQSYTFDLQNTILEGHRARISEFSCIYMVNLIQQHQAALNFSVFVSSEIEHQYLIDLSSLTDNYYNNITDLITDLNTILTNFFDDSIPSKSSSYKPVISFDTKKNKIVFTAGTTTQVSIQSSNSNFWYKLGFPNGNYDYNAVINSVSYPSIIPIAEMYIKMNNVINENAIIKSDLYAPTNSSNVVGIITFHQVKLGDLFYYRMPTIPAWPIKLNNNSGSFHLTLLNSIGQPVNINSDFRITIDFMY
ncbi:MAG: hypothetical protein H6630_08960 [Arcobacter sp.]|nr:hypothetical protein [Arcobacter sp.]